MTQPNSQITTQTESKEEKSTTPKKAEEDKIIAEKKLKNLDSFDFARINLLILACLTLFNLAFLAFGLDISLLFSAIIPYFAMFLGVEFINAGSAQGWIYIILAVLICAFYLFCYFYSQKRPKWLKAAFICFLFDCWLCVYLLLIDFDLTNILSMLFMLWMLFCFISGIIDRTPNGKEQDSQSAEKK